MFFRRKQTLVEEVVKKSVLVQTSRPIPLSIEAELKEEERKAYNQLCDEIGFRPAALVKDKLLSFLQDHQIKVYPYEKVKAYLDLQFGISPDGWRHTWGWCPLREIDRRKSDLFLPEKDGLPRFFEVDNGEFELDRRYHGAIPFAVLDHVKQLIETIPELSFFVSDVMQPRDRKGDPFLAVTSLDMNEMIVIAEWDEPSFRS